LSQGLAIFAETGEFRRILELLAGKRDFDVLQDVISTPAPTGPGRCRTCGLLLRRHAGCRTRCRTGGHAGLSRRPSGSSRCRLLNRAGCSWLRSRTGSSNLGRHEVQGIDRNGDITLADPEEAADTDDDGEDAAFVIHQNVIDSSDILTSSANHVCAHQIRAEELVRTLANNETALKLKLLLCDHLLLHRLLTRSDNRSGGHLLLLTHLSLLGANRHLLLLIDRLELCLLLLTELLGARQLTILHAFRDDLLIAHGNAVHRQKNLRLVLKHFDHEKRLGAFLLDNAGDGADGLTLLAHDFTVHEIGNGHLLDLRLLHLSRLLGHLLLLHRLLLLSRLRRCLRIRIERHESGRPEGRCHQKILHGSISFHLGNLPNQSPRFQFVPGQSVELL
jgi:hypothetical protein